MAWLLGVVGVALIAGGFGFIGTGTESKGRLIAASTLWLVGLVLLILAAVVHRRSNRGGGAPDGAPAAANPTSGPSIVNAATLINTGTIAHTVNQNPQVPVGLPPSTVTAPSPPPPLTQAQRRAQVRAQLELARKEGASIGLAADLAKLNAGLASWQPQVLDLLERAFVSTEPAQWFESVTGSGDHPVQVLQEQMRYLGQLISDLHQFTIKEYWQP